MTVSERIRTITNKIAQKKVQKDLDRQTVKISALSSGYVGQYEFSTAGEDVLPEKDLLEKAATIKRFEYLMLGSELKKQTEIPKKLFHGSGKVQKFDQMNYFKNFAVKIENRK